MCLYEMCDMYVKTHVILKKLVAKLMRQLVDLKPRCGGHCVLSASAGTSQLVLESVIVCKIAEKLL